MKDIRELNMEETERKKYWEILDFIQDDCYDVIARDNYAYVMIASRG